MADVGQIERARAFMALHHAPGGFVLPNAWDAMSARLFESAGFSAVGTTSGGLNWSLGYQDGERPPWQEVTAASARIARVLRVPLSIDLEAGYAGTPEALARNVEDIVRTGAVGINLEDQLAGKLRPMDEACARIRAAREAADRAGVPIVINARTDVFHVRTPPETPYEEAVRRALAYLQAGASAIFVFGISDLPMIARLVKAIPAPVNVVGRPGGPSFADFSGVGVARVSLAAGMSLYAYGAVDERAKQIKQSGSFDGLASSLTRARAQELLAGESK